MDDCIDTLPDEILGAILSKLQIKEAVRTSVLSRRWKSVWKLISCLNFDGTKNTNRLDYMLIKPERCKYINYVNQVLELYKESSNLEELKITFGLRKNHCNEIDKWICFAMAKRIKSLKLNFASLWGYDTDKFYAFQEPLLQLPSNVSGNFDSLKTLRLKGVDVTGRTVGCILSNCPLLETLTLQNATSLRRLHVNGSSLKLKHLKIKDCFQLDVLEISAENLLSVDYCGNHHIDMSFRNVPLLSEFLIGGIYVEHWVHHADELSYDCSQLHNLTLNLSWLVTLECYSSIFPAKFSVFSNLKHLKLKSFRINVPNLGFLDSLLEASPSLRSLKVEVKLVPCRLLWSFQNVERHRHNSLKVIQIVSWSGVKSDVEFATYLLEIAVSLDKIIIDPSFNYKKKYESLQKLPTEGEKEAARESARGLQSKLPPGAVLLIR